MRLFIAIEAPAGVLGALDEAVAPLRAAQPDLRWTGPEAWHLTLAFLGEVGEGVVPGLAARLERAARRRPRLDLAVEGAGAFPGAARARVLWAGVRGDRESLSRLSGSVSAGARRAGAPAMNEGRRLRPHLTLARCRTPSDVRPLVAALASYVGEPWTADRIQLIRSRPQGQPRYETLGSWPLRASG